MKAGDLVITTQALRIWASPHEAKPARLHREGCALFHPGVKPLRTPRCSCHTAIDLLAPGQIGTVDRVDTQSICLRLAGHEPVWVDLAGLTVHLPGAAAAPVRRFRGPELPADLLVVRDAWTRGHPIPPCASPHPAKPGELVWVEKKETYTEDDLWRSLFRTHSSIGPCLHLIRPEVPAAHALRVRWEDRMVLPLPASRAPLPVFPVFPWPERPTPGWSA